MRLVLPLALLLAASTRDGAHRPRDRGPSLPAVQAGDTAGGVIALRAPGPEAVLVRAGSFMMGSSDVEVLHAKTLCKIEFGAACPERIEEIFEAELPPHEVFLSSFWIDRTEVTVARYRQCVAAGACDEPPYASGGQRFDQPELPVVLVTWGDAQRFCAWAGGRLPTEAEWERAARGPSRSGRRYPFGNVYNPYHMNHGKLSMDTLGLEDSDGFLELAPVGSFPAGRTPDGIEDLAGNVEEWVADYFSEYPAGSAKDPQGAASGEERVIRGGSYTHWRPFLRAASRGHDAPATRRSWRGFRCAQSG